MRTPQTVSLVSSGSGTHSPCTPALLLKPVSTSSRNDDLVQVVKDISRWITTNISYDVKKWAGCQIQSEPNIAGLEETRAKVVPDWKQQQRGGEHCGSEWPHKQWGCVDSSDLALCSPSTVSIRPLSVPPCSPQTDTHRGPHPCRQSAGKEALLQGKATCRGYSDLFCLLCRHAGIRATKIQGLVKTASYVPGNPLDPEQPNHEWNAVWIQGLGWKLIDLTWAAGHVTQHPRHFLQEFNDHFLFTDPRDFIRDHFPCDQKWQLLKDPLTIGDFENDLFLRPGYFINNIRGCNLSSGVHHCFEESMVVSFQLSQPMVFTYSLTQMCTGLSMDQCVVCKWTNQMCSFRLYLPKAGHYLFCVYGRPSIHITDRKIPMSCLLTQSIHSHWGKTPRFAETRLALLPESQLWGPTSHFEALGLSLQSNFTSRLHLYKDTATTPVISTHVPLPMAVVVYPYREKHRAFSGRGKLIKHMTVQQQASFRLKVNGKGTQMWRLALFAQGQNSEMFTCICNFLMTQQAQSCCSDNFGVSGR